MLNTSKSSAHKSAPQIGWIEKLRRFIDGDNDEDEAATVLREIAPRRPRERFYQELARQIDKLVNEEAFGGPNVPLTVPAEIVVLMAPDVYAEWHGQYRRRLIDGLEAAIGERVRIMAGPAGNRTVTPKITIEENPSLDTGKFDAVVRGEGKVFAVAASTDPEATLVYLENVNEEPTLVIIPESPLYEVEIFLDSELIKRVPVSKKRAIIGRGSKVKPVDVPLNDPAVSREHAVMDLEDNRLWLTSLGQNITKLGGKPLDRRHRRQVRSGESIEICRFTLRVAQLK